MTLTRQYQLQRRTGSSCCAATRASWWQAATWPTSKAGTVWDGAVRVVSLPSGPGAAEWPLTRAAGLPSQCAERWRLLSLADSNPPRAWTLRSGAPRWRPPPPSSGPPPLSGDGSRRSRLAARATALMGQQSKLRVEMTPWLSEAAADALDRADLLLVPSLWPEPFGMVGVEAARRGVPSVAFAVGGIPEWLIDGATGTLVPPRPTPAASRRPSPHAPQTPRLAARCEPRVPAPRASTWTRTCRPSTRCSTRSAAPRGMRHEPARAVRHSRTRPSPHGGVSHGVDVSRTISGVPATRPTCWPPTT